MSQQAIHNATPAGEDADMPAAGWADYLDAIARHVALLAAWIAMCGSLFFSEVMGWPPCELCWYQRVLMYPLAIMLAVGILRRDQGLHLYVLPFSIIGIGVSLYHHLLIMTNWFPPPACSTGIPCNVDYLYWFGFITIPFLALTAFIIITAAMIAWAWLQPSGTGAPEADDHAAGFGADRLAVPGIIVVVILFFVLLRAVI